MKEVKEIEIPDLAISAAKVAAIVARARQFDVKDVVTDLDSSSNASDDAMLSVLEDHNDDPVRTELTAIIRGLNEDEQADLVALTWLGRAISMIGMTFAQKLHVRTTDARRNTCWECRFWATISRRPSHNSATLRKSSNSRFNRRAPPMPYRTNADLPPPVRNHLPPHAQDIYREAFNHAFASHAGDRRQEEIAHRTAWSAVKRSFVKLGDAWVALHTNRYG
jgi:cation transport regulator